MLTSPDIIDRALQRLKHVHPTMDDERLSALEDVLRAEFGGTVSRVAKRGTAEREALKEAIRAARGKPVRELAKLLGIHASTVRRVLGSLPEANRDG